MFNSTQICIIRPLLVWTPMMSSIPGLADEKPPCHSDIRFVDGRWCEIGRADHGAMSWSLLNCSSLWCCQMSLRCGNYCQEWVPSESKGLPRRRRVGFVKEGFASKDEKPSLKEESWCGAIGAKRPAQNYERKHLVSVRSWENT